MKFLSIIQSFFSKLYSHAKNNLISTFLLSILALHFASYCIEKISIGGNLTSTAKVILNYFNNLQTSFPSGVFTMLSAFLLFKYGTKNLAERQQLSSFRKKYIELKNEIDKNKKDILLANNQDDLHKELKNFSDHFVKYTNLIYEEMLETENHLIMEQLKNKWIKSFQQEVLDWKSLFSEVFKNLNLDQSKATQNTFDFLFNIFSIKTEEKKVDYINIDTYYQDLFDLKTKSSKELLSAHNILQNSFRKKFKSLMTDNFKGKHSHTENQISPLIDELESLKIHSNSEIFLKKLNDVIDKLNKIKSAA